MGLLDGQLQAVFGSVFKPLLLDGKIEKIELVDDGYGGYSEAPTEADIKVMVEGYSAFTRAQAGIPDKDVKLIILQHQVTISPDLDSKVRVLAQGEVVEQLFSIQKIEKDPAQASWTVQGRPTNG